MIIIIISPTVPYKRISTFLLPGDDSCQQQKSLHIRKCNAKGNVIMIVQYVVRAISCF